MELLALMIKQQEKNLAADNQAIKAQQQLLQNLHPKEHSFGRLPETKLPSKLDQGLGVELRKHTILNIYL